MTDEKLERIRELHARFYTDQEIADDIDMHVSSVGIWRREHLKLETHYSRSARRHRQPAHHIKPRPKVKTRKHKCIGGCGGTYILPVGRFTCDSCYARNTAMSSSMGLEGGSGGRAIRYAGQE